MYLLEEFPRTYEIIHDAAIRIGQLHEQRRLDGLCFICVDQVYVAKKCREKRMYGWGDIVLCWCLAPFSRFGWKNNHRPFIQIIIYATVVCSSCREDVATAVPGPMTVLNQPGHLHMTRASGAFKSHKFINMWICTARRRYSNFSVSRLD